MLLIFIGVLLVLGGLALSWYLGPGKEKRAVGRRLFEPTPTWPQLARQFAVIVVAWALIFAGFGAILVGMFRFGLWLMSWA